MYNSSSLGAAAAAAAAVAVAVAVVAAAAAAHASQSMSGWSRESIHRQRRGSVIHPVRWLPAFSAWRMQPCPRRPPSPWSLFFSCRGKEAPLISH